MAVFVDHYRVLGVSPTASADEIRRAYRHAVHRHHADRNPDDGDAVERTRAIVAARDVLCDPWRRARFDMIRALQPRDALRADPLVDATARWAHDPSATPPPPPPPRSVGWAAAVVVGATGLAAALGLSLIAVANLARAAGKRAGE
jgi:curved DNA-binding protein CbpA